MLCFWAPRPFVGILHVPILTLYPFALVMALHLHQLGDMLEDIPALVPFLELVPGLLFTLDRDKIPHLLVIPVV